MGYDDWKIQQYKENLGRWSKFRVATAVIINFSFINIDFLRFLIETGVIVLLNGCAIFMLGFSQVERKSIITVVKTKVLPKIRKA